MAKRTLIPGTLDLVVLQVFLAGGRQHGFGVARSIEKISSNELQLNQGTIHASLIRLKRRGWIQSEWGTSENNRKAKFYEITKPGRMQLTAATRQWEWFSNLINHVLELREGILFSSVVHK
ncbi:MAG: hypothetical protein BGO25_03080 [Acidobacteriales bacterium 59-55]|nr:PadR family transcriptional regulator [Terriglobales bacterium]OJV40146.1 MAG: hypothetical protein BGO25_03080 [Acidobacteriales bacterium 59-55]